MTTTWRALPPYAVEHNDLVRAPGGAVLRVHSWTWHPWEPTNAVRITGAAVDTGETVTVTVDYLADVMARN